MSQRVAATLSMPGLTIAALLVAASAGCAQESSGSASPPEGPAASSIDVAVIPSTARCDTSSKVAFSAAVTGTSDGAVTWSVAEGAAGGAVDSAGTYTAPASAGTFHVVATSDADGTTRGTATVVVSAPSGGGGGGGGAGGTGLWVTGYWSDWSVGSGSSAIHLPYNKIDWTAITHLTVAFASPSGGSIQYMGGNLSSSLARQITAAGHAAGRKVLLMIGGAGSASSLAAATGNTTASAQAFAQGIYNVAHADGFDGIDIDWEGIYAGGNQSGGVDDPQRVKNLATALRSLWPGIIITEAIGWDQTGQSFFSGFKDASGNWLIDQFNVMNYDAANAWPGWVSWFMNALDGAASNHPSSLVEALTNLSTTGGVPKSRIGCGIPFYGSAWSGGSPPVTGPRQTISSGASATQGQDITWTYKNIMDNYWLAWDGTQGYQFDTVAGVPYLSFPTPYSRNGLPKITFLSFDDPTSIAGKGAWIKANGYGGTIIWLIQEGVTDGTTYANPLLDAVKAAFLN